MNRHSPWPRHTDSADKDFIGLQTCFTIRIEFRTWLYSTTALDSEQDPLVLYFARSRVACSRMRQNSELTTIDVQVLTNSATTKHPIQTRAKSILLVSACLSGCDPQRCAVDCVCVACLSLTDASWHRISFVSSL